MSATKILWTDDEIDLLKPHIIYLEGKGYEVDTANNGEDALDLVEEQDYDIIFLDENMPGISGLEVLSQIKAAKPQIPVVMITRSEEEDIMEAAIGSKIADYLIKPVNPNQILLTIKKNIDNKRLIAKETLSSYQSKFGKLSMEVMNANHSDDWKAIYKQLVFWELELKQSQVEGLDEVFKMQKKDANNAFCKFIRKNYKQWFEDENERPEMSPDLLENKVFPHVRNGQKTVLFLIDNLKYDHWKIIEPFVSEHFKVEEESMFYSILPTVTQYARNSIFAGLMPLEIKKQYPDLWRDDDEEGAKNEFEYALLKEHLKRKNIQASTHFEKINNVQYGKKVLDNLDSYVQNDLTTIVINFVDFLSHARTDTEVIKELASDEAAYRSIVLSWFQHSNFLEILKKLSKMDVKVVIGTDHGSVLVQNPVKVVGDRYTNSNLRYKQGKSLGYNAKEVLEMGDPAKIKLPSSAISSSYIFATDNDYLVYPKNYNQYVKMYKNTFQHGGVSLDEMVVPVVTLSSK